MFFNINPWNIVTFDGFESAGKYAPVRNKVPRQGHNMISRVQGPCCFGPQCGVTTCVNKHTPRRLILQKQEVMSKEVISSFSPPLPFKIQPDYSFARGSLPPGVRHAFPIAASLYIRI